MRRLRPNEKAQTGDWFYIHDHYSDQKCFWTQLSAKPMPLKSKTIRQNDLENKALHYPIIVMRPTARERKAGIQPEKPYIFSPEEWAQVKKVRDYYSAQL